MTLHSVWGNSAPPGPWNIYNDGAPSIGLFSRFYMVNRPSTGGAVGVKIWIPANAASAGFVLPEEVTVHFWRNGGTELGAETLVKTVPLTAGPGEWQEVFFDGLVQFPAQDFPRIQMGVFYYFGPDYSSGPYQHYKSTYVYGSAARVTTQPTPSATFPDLVWSEDMVGFRSPRTGNLAAATDGAVSYGIDLIITDDDNWVPPGSEPEPEIVFGTDVVTENALPGLTKADWFDGVPSEVMPAFGRSTYVQPGETMSFSVDYNQAFTFDVHRLGHYAGGGARLIKSGLEGTPAAQPAPVVIPNSNGAVTCSAWSINATWEVPANALPGWYQILLRGQNGDLGHVLFEVSDALSKKPIVIVTGDATWGAAYNGYGGNNVYGASKDVGNASARALCSSYDKPVISRDYVPQTHFFNATYPMLKWAERMGFEVGYATVEQIKNDPSILNNRDLIVFAGHNEYVPQVMYDKVIELLSLGQNIINAAGNDFFWRVKFTSGSFDNPDGRVMWCKKDTMDGPTGTDHVGGQPFTTQADWTGTWQDTRYAMSIPSEMVFGDRFIANGVRNDRVSVPYDDMMSPAWRNCPGIDALQAGQTYQFTPGSLGMEWDMPTSAGGFEQMYLSSTIVQLTGVAADINGQQYNLTETAEHAIALVKNGPSMILNLNSDQWSWTLDSLHLRGSAPADVNAMQMMLNVMYDMGANASPASVAAAGLVEPDYYSWEDYGFSSPSDYMPPGMYYSDGFEWTQVFEAPSSGPI